jgi:nitronate monooxygenase
MSFRALLDALPIPILQAPMWGASTPAMALAVAQAGGFGSIAAAGWSGDEIAAQADAFRAQTEAPFGINLLKPDVTAASADVVDDGLARLKPWYDALGAELPARPNTFSQDFDGQVEGIVRVAPAVASVAFGILRRDQVEALQRVGTFVLGTANTVAEARAWADVGADGICAQGMEAGGHRGNFLADVDESLVGTVALTATVLEAVDLPVIAAGGIMDGRGVAATLALGASAAQMGTAFLLTPEAQTSAPWRRAIAQAKDDPTRLTRAFSGRFARGIENRYMREMRPIERDLPPYPVTNRLTTALRAKALAADDPELMSNWAGQAVKLAREGSAGELIARWWDEAKAASRALAARVER